MICCKIIANYGAGSFTKLCNALVERGDILWEHKSLYFCNTDNPKVNATLLKGLLRKAGYQQFYLDVYDYQNQPHESEYVDGWLYDKIIKINYKMCEDESQAVFRDISRGLDMLDEEIAQLQKNTIEEAESG